MSDARKSLLERLRNNPHTFTLEDQIRRGSQARQILNSEVFDDAFLDAEFDLVAEWRENREESPVGRERAHAAVHGLDVLYLALRRIADDGLAAEKRVEDEAGDNVA